MTDTSIDSNTIQLNDNVPHNNDNTESTDSTTNQSNDVTCTASSPSNKRKRDASINTQSQPARIQLNSTDNHSYQHSNNTTEYNIWYNKYQKSHNKDYQRPRATTRCNPLIDCGYTNATVSNDYYCIKFAQGRCTYGYKCNYIHDIPDGNTATRIDLLHDVFGRERHTTDKTDMSGVGNINRDNRTLFISGVYTPDLAENNGIAAYNSCMSHFSLFGPIEHISVKTKHSCVFIRYKYRVNAEFAKIAMSDQSLDHNEQLNIRWAHDDPNPGAIKRIHNSNVKQVYHAVRNNELQQQSTQHQHKQIPDHNTADGTQSQSQYQYVGNGYYYDTTNQQYLYWDTTIQQYVVYEPPTAASVDTTQHVPKLESTSDTVPTSNVDDVVNEFITQTTSASVQHETDDALAAFDSLLDKIEANKQSTVKQ